MKSTTLNLGNRQVKPAKVIEKTHHNESEEEPITMGSKIQVKSRESRVKKVLKTIRFTEEENEKISKYLEFNDDMKFSDLIRYFFEKENII